MKIAMLIARFPPTLGGAEIQCYRLSTWLTRQGHDVLVLTEKSFADQPHRERVNGFEVIRFQTWGNTRTRSLVYGLKAFLYLVTHKRFDVLHAHMIATPAMAASAASFILRTPVLIKIAGGRQTGDFSTSRRYAIGRVKLWLFSRARPYVVCPSPETFEEAKSFGIPSEKLFYIPNGVDTEHFRPMAESKAALREKYALPPEAPVAIYVGRWAKGKGVEKILDLWEAGIHNPPFSWHLLMILSEPPPEKIAGRIQPMKDRIHLAVCVTDPSPYYQASDLAILLSEGEGMSNFLLEAMSSGLAALTTQAAALPDTQGEKSGTHTLAMTDRLIQESLHFLADPGHLNELGGAARQYIQSNYSLDRAGRAYLSLYQKMVN